MAELKLPKGVGPHEGQELELLLSGDKSVALFFEIAPDWVRYATRFGLRRMQFQIPSKHVGSYPCWIVFWPKASKAAFRLKRLVLRAPKGFDATHEALIGTILGYSPEAIAAYVRHAQRSIDGV